MNDPLQRRAMLGFIAIAAGALACRRAFGGDGGAAERVCDTLEPAPPPDADAHAYTYADADNAPDTDAVRGAAARRPAAARAHPLSGAAAERRRLLAACRAASR